MIRKSVVAGSFYPSDYTRLTAVFDQQIPASHRQLDTIGIIMPHAGYQYSGRIAGSTYSHIRLPRRFIILSPNHNGIGTPIGLMSEGTWETPLDAVELDGETARKLRETCSLNQEDDLAHRSEHAIEVSFPFSSTC